jgi:hypothetical protein
MSENHKFKTPALPGFLFGDIWFFGEMCYNYC